MPKTGTAGDHGIHSMQRTVLIVHMSLRATKTVPYIQSIETSIGENRYYWRGKSPSNSGFYKIITDSDISYPNRSSELQN